MHSLANASTGHGQYGIVIGQVSGEVVEASNGTICRLGAGHSNHHKSWTSLRDSACYQMMRFGWVQRMCYPESLFEERSRAPNSLEHCKCSRCGQYGHYASNLDCKKRPDMGLKYRGEDWSDSDDIE